MCFIRVRKKNKKLNRNKKDLKNGTKKPNQLKKRWDGFDF